MYVQPDKRGKFWGDLHSNGEGCIRWPFHQMQVSDWFTVRWSERDPENVRKIAGVRGSQLNRRFGTSKRDPDHPGKMVVWRKQDDPDAHRLGHSWVSKRTKFDYEAFREFAFEQYMVKTDDLHWEKVREVGQKLIVPATRLAGDGREMLQLEALDQRFIVELYDEGFVIYAVEHHVTVKAWHYARTWQKIEQQHIIERLMS